MAQEDNGLDGDEVFGFLDPGRHCGGVVAVLFFRLGGPDLLAKGVGHSVPGPVRLQIADELLGLEAEVVDLVGGIRPVGLRSSGGGHEIERARGKPLGDFFGDGVIGRHL